MAIDIGQIDLTVRTVDDRSVVSPDVLEIVVREVLARIDARRSAEALHAADRNVWGSVREGVVR